MGTHQRIKIISKQKNEDGEWVIKIAYSYLKSDDLSMVPRNLKKLIEKRGLEWIRERFWKITMVPTRSENDKYYTLPDDLDIDRKYYNYDREGDLESLLSDDYFLDHRNMKNMEHNFTIDLDRQILAYKYLFSEAIDANNSQCMIEPTVTDCYKFDELDDLISN